MASSTPSPAMKNGDYRNWAELPPELTSSILLHLGPIDILHNAQKVCRSWRRVCNDPSMWRKIDLGKSDGYVNDLEAMCHHAVDLSQGGLLEINIEHYTTNSLLPYIADRSSNLRRLSLFETEPVMSRENIEAFMKLTLLEELQISYESISEKYLKVIGQSCPNLRTLKLHMYCYGDTKSCDKVALAIAETMPGLCHLRLYKNGLSDTGLNAILKCCPHLKVLELRKCSNITLVGNMGK